MALSIRINPIIRDLDNRIHRLLRTIDSRHDFQEVFGRLQIMATSILPPERVYGGSVNTVTDLYDMILKEKYSSDLSSTSYLHMYKSLRALKSMFMIANCHHDELETFMQNLFHFEHSVQHEDVHHILPDISFQELLLSIVDEVEGSHKLQDLIGSISESEIGQTAREDIKSSTDLIRSLIISRMIRVGDWNSLRFLVLKLESVGLSDKAHQIIRQITMKSVLYGYQHVHGFDDEPGRDSEAGYFQGTLEIQGYSEDFLIPSVPLKGCTRIALSEFDDDIQSQALRDDAQKSLKVQNIHLEQRREEVVTFQQHSAALLIQKDVQNPNIRELAQTMVTLTSESQKFEWKDYGFNLSIPQGCLPKGVNTVDVVISVSLCEDVLIPFNSELVSGVYSVTVSDDLNLVKPLEMEIQHCASIHTSEDCSCLLFVRADSSAVSTVNFTPIPGGVFQRDSSYGRISLQRFSRFGIVRTFLGLFQRTNRDEEYDAHVYITERSSDPRVHFVVIRKLNVCLQIVKERYPSESYKQHTSFFLKFESDELKFDIPIDGLTTDSGWKILPLFKPTLNRCDINGQLNSRQFLPKCEFALEWCSEERQPVRLLYKFEFTGAKGHNHFWLTFQPDTTGASSAKNHHPTPLSPTITDLLKELLSTSSEWENIGLLLGLDFGKLNTVKSDNRGDAKACLREMLMLWLQRVDPPPTWCAIIEAIECLGNQQLTRDLRQKYAQ